MASRRPLFRVSLNDATTAEDVEAAVEAGEDLDAQVPFSHETALINHSRNGNLNVVDALLRHHASLTITNFNGDTALMVACLEGQTPVVLRLLQEENGLAQVNSTSLTSSPLICASSNGHTDVVDILIQHNTQVNIAAPNGKTPLKAACSGGKVDVVDRLLQQGASVNDPGVAGGMTPLMCASEKGHLDIVDRMIAFGADINATSRFGHSALMFACRNASVDVVDRLISVGVDVNYAGSHGWTALMSAAFKGSLEIVKLLLAAKADPLIHNNEDQKASDLAVSDEIKAILQDHEIANA